MEKQPILSLCIPTNGAVEWVLPVIESIYNQGYDNEKFEVVITDNGKDSQLPEHIVKMHYSNLRYKQTTDEGFLNLVTSLKDGKGLFCKMVNHRSIMTAGSIEKMVALVEKYRDSQPMIYCSSGNSIRKGSDFIVECSNLDELIQNLSYWCSWSAGIGFWQKDIPSIDKIVLNKMFPNASLLFNVRENSRFVLWDYPYQKMEDDAGKGGYDVFNTFAVVLLDLLSSLRYQGRVTELTFIQFKRELLGFLTSIYCNEKVMPTKHTFILQNIRQSMQVYYGEYYYRKMVLTAWVHAALSMVIRPLRKFKDVLTPHRL